MKTCFIFLSVLFSTLAHSQTVSGLYSGTLYNDTTKLLQQYQLALSEYRGKITGYSYTTFVLNDTFYYGIRKVKALIKEDKLFVEDDDMLVNNFPEAPAKGVKRLTVILLPKDGDTLQSLSGRWETNRTKKWLPVTGSVQAQRDNDSSHSPLIGHLKELNIIPVNIQQTAAVTTIKQEVKPSATKPPAPATPSLLNYTERNNKVLETITISSDSLVLYFYDNGVVDGDVISVYVAGESIINNAKLTEAAIKKTIYITSNSDSIEIKLVAENMGTLPPNTGLLVVYDGNVKYNLNFSADLSTNASIIFRKKK